MPTLPSEYVWLTVPAILLSMLMTALISAYRHVPLLSSLTMSPEPVPLLATM